MKQEVPSSRDKVSSEVFIGVCEFMNSRWECGNIGTLVGKEVCVDEGIDYLYVCVSCAERFGDV
jgi:hypothetical protein